MNNKSQAKFALNLLKKYVVKLREKNKYNT